MVLHHVPQRADPVIIGDASLQPYGFADGDLDMIYGRRIPQRLKQHIAETTSSGTVFINASGNDGNDINRLPEWPAAFQLPGKITVASYNVQQYLSFWSNYGILVDLAAPGEKILSLVPPDPGQPEGQLCDKSGTSMATPFVAGVAALLLSAKPSLSPTAVSDAINSSVISGAFGVRTHGKLNALHAAQWALSH